MSYLELIEILKKNPDYELELRIGKRTGEVFQSGIDKVLFDEICDELSKCEEIVNKDESWHESMDVFYDFNNTEYRTRVNYLSSTMKINSQTIKKKKVKNVHVNLQSNYMFRVSLSEEKNINPEHIPAVVYPKHVRLKHTKNFFLNSDGTKTWCICASKTWGGTTRTEVENLQHAETPIYEVEVELVDTNVYLSKKTCEYVFRSIVQKGCSLLGIPDATYKVC